MSVLPILIHPDPRLKRVCAPVADPATVAGLIEDMFETMYDAPGIGLAAAQVGADACVLVMDCAAKEEDPDPLALINPEILETSEELNEHEEGCLSIPEQYAMIARPAEAVVRWTTPLSGIEERRFTGLRATCVQHEIDHLNGRLFIDHIGSVRRQMITQKMKKLKRERARA